MSAKHITCTLLLNILHILLPAVDAKNSIPEYHHSPCLLYTSYTLHISANKHLYIQCPKNIKSDIDGIIDYLSEANHDILVGFNEKNRLKVQEIQGTPMHFEKFIAFLNKRV